MRNIVLKIGANLEIMNDVYILLGGNLGDKSKIFEETRKHIAESIGTITKRSSVYVTEAWGFESEPFWNQALLSKTTLPPHELMKQTQAIEIMMGRIKHTDQYEARPIDIDILFYADLQLNTMNLTIPHPKIGDRRFVLVPLNEIAPDMIHPVTGLTIKAMLMQCTDGLKVERID